MPLFFLYIYYHLLKLQGEPLFNYREVSKAIGILSDPEGMAISKRKIVVSTAGVVPNMAKLMKDWPQVQLAVSLHAVTDEVFFSFSFFFFPFLSFLLFLHFLKFISR